MFRPEIQKGRLPVGIYVGSFNPWHGGHQDILNKAEGLFSKVFVGIAQNENKDLACLDSRLKRLRAQLQGIPVYSFALLQDFITLIEDATNEPAYLIRGLREGKDFDYELKNIIEYVSPKKVIFLTSDSEYRGFSSTKLRSNQ